MVAKDLGCHHRNCLAAVEVRGAERTTEGALVLFRTKNRKPGCRGARGIDEK